MRIHPFALVLLLAACQSSQNTASGGVSATSRLPNPQLDTTARRFETGCGRIDEVNALIIAADTTQFPHPAYLENVVRQVAMRLPSRPSAGPLATRALFMISGDGSLSGLRLDKPSGNTALDSATVRAIAEAGRAGAFGALPAGAVQDSLWLTLEHRRAAGTSTSNVRYFLEQPPRITRSIPLPAHPPYQTADTGGRVRVRFVVDTTGWVDVHSFQVVEASHGELVGVMRHVVGRTRFAPAEVGGCQVRREMQMGFEFQGQQPGR